jgi:hypothetical protein
MVKGDMWFCPDRTTTWRATLAPFLPRGRAKDIATISRDIIHEVWAITPVRFHGHDAIQKAHAEVLQLVIS